jgi:hypothetical protein
VLGKTSKTVAAASRAISFATIGLAASEEDGVPASKALLFPAAGERPLSVQDDQHQVVLWPAGLRMVVKTPVPADSGLQ